MKMKSIYVVMTAMLLAFAAAGWPQGTTTGVNGKIKSGDKPLAGAQVVLTYLDTGKPYKAQTDKSGEYSFVGVVRGNYEIEVRDASGQGVYKQKRSILGQGGANEVIDIDVGKGSTISKEERERLEAENAKTRNINGIIEQANKAITAKNWKDAEPLLKQMIAAEPKRWEFYQALGNAQANQEEYEDTVDSYQKGIEVAQGVVSGTTPKDPKNPSTDPAKAKTGIAQMLTAQGNAYLKLKKSPEAIESFTKAAELDPNPGVAYFNLCATQYNSGNVQGALGACDKAIAADPKKADAYFIKGSLLVGQGTMDKDNKIKAPPGTEEALKKYLELAPDGAHAADVKQMLEFLGAKLETSFKAKKK
jgi:tetratricopeptide (TPR) repeat protein